MFYDDHCKTDNQKAVFKAILELSKDSTFIAIQQLNYLGIPDNELKDILIHFEKHNLFKNVQHLSQKYPVCFSIRELH